MTALSLFVRGLTIIEITSAISGWIAWAKWKNTYVKWFTIYLTIISLLSVCYYYFINKHQFANAIVFFKIAVPLEILFLLWFFYVTNCYKYKSFLIISAVIFILVWIAENFFYPNNTYFLQSRSYTIGTLSILINIVLYFLNLSQSNRIKNFHQLFSFWAVLGMLVFYLGTFPFYGLYNELVKDLSLYIPIAWVAYSLNYCMYILFSIAFILGKKNNEIQIN
jgi:hypothetical protein